MTLSRKIVERIHDEYNEGKIVEVDGLGYALFEEVNALAGQWIDALAEYTGILNSEIGWSGNKSVAFIMGKYGSGIRESGDLRTAMFVQTYLEQMFGG